MSSLITASNHLLRRLGMGLSRPPECRFFASTSRLVDAAAAVTFGEKLLSMSLGDAIVLVVSSVVATLIGYAGWLCRGLVSATSYTLIGVANKLGTVLLAIAFLDKHASPLGVLALVCCIAASSQYKQSPLRADVAKAQGAGDVEVASA